MTFGWSINFMMMISLSIPSNTFSLLAPASEMDMREERIACLGTILTAAYWPVLECLASLTRPAREQTKGGFSQKHVSLLGKRGKEGEEEKVGRLAGREGGEKSDASNPNTRLKLAPLHRSSHPSHPDLPPWHPLNLPSSVIQICPACSVR